MRFDIVGPCGVENIKVENLFLELVYKSLTITLGEWSKVSECADYVTLTEKLLLKSSWKSFDSLSIRHMTAPLCLFST